MGGRAWHVVGAGETISKPGGTKEKRPEVRGNLLLVKTFQALMKRRPHFFSACLGVGQVGAMLGHEFAERDLQTRKPLSNALGA